MLLRCVKQQQREEVEVIKFPKNWGITTIHYNKCNQQPERTGRESAALQKQNEDFKKSLEQINDKQYLVQLTNKILEKKMPKDHYEGSL